MPSVTPVELGNPLPLSCTIPTGASGLFPQAVVYDSSDSLVGTFDLTEIGASGRYTNLAVVPVTKELFTALFVVYTDAGHTTESALWGRHEEMYLVMDKIADAVWDEILTGATHNIATSAGKRLRQIQENLGYENGAVYIDTINGNPGTELFENGTVGNPSDSITDALAIAVALGLRQFIVYPGSNITLVADLDSYVLKGIHWTLALGGRSISGTGILGADVSGVGTGADEPHFFDCFMGAVTLPPCHLHSCGLEVGVVAGASGDYILDQCISAVAGLGTPYFDFAAVGNVNASFRHHSGGIEVRNMSVGDLMSLEGHGKYVLAASCSGGVLAVRGAFDRTDNAGGAVTESIDARLSLSGIRAEIMGYVLEGNILGWTMEQSMNFVRKVARNRLEQDDGDTDNLDLYDDDGSTVIFTWDVQAKSGGPIVQPAVAPAKRIPS